MAYRFVTSVRGTLVSMIYTKTIDLSITALDESAAVTLMASDTGMKFVCPHDHRHMTLIITTLETICTGFTNLHELWAVPIELAIALYILHMQLGLAFLAPAVVAIFSTSVIMMMAKYMGNAQKIWIQGIQTRVSVTATMLSSMKVGFAML